MSRNEDAILHSNWAREAEAERDFLRARMEYLKCVESWKQAGDETDLREAQDDYTAFVRRGPIFETLLGGLLPIIQAAPGILQSDITKRAESLKWPSLYDYNRPVAREDIYYALYFA